MGWLPAAVYSFGDVDHGNDYEAWKEAGLLSMNVHWRILQVHCSVPLGS